MRNGICVLIILLLFIDVATAQNSLTKSFSVNNFQCQDSYTAGKENVLTFSFVANSDDFEYIDSISLTFPAGFKVVSASDSIGGEYLDLAKGNVVCWGDNDNNYGGITTDGTTLSFSVTVVVPGGISGKQLVTYYMSGDGYGQVPHEARGYITVSSSECEEGQVPLTVSVFTDNYPGETSWYLTNASESIVYRGVTGLETALNLYTKSVCMNALDTIKFKIMDEYGDGICCYNGNGYYSVESPCGVIKSGSMFNEEEDTTFVVPFPKTASFNFVKKNLGTKNDEGMSIIQACDGGFFVTANNENSSKGGYDITLLRINAMGETMWTSKVGTQFNDFAIKTIETSDGGYLVMGYTYPQDQAWSTGRIDKIDAKGQITWSLDLGQDVDKDFYFCTDAVETDDYYLVAGKHSDSVLVTKVSKTGEILSTNMNYGSADIGYNKPLMQKLSDGTMLMLYDNDNGDATIRYFYSNATFGDTLKLPDVTSGMYVVKFKALNNGGVVIGGNMLNDDNYVKPSFVILDGSFALQQDVMLDDTRLYDDFTCDIKELDANTLLVASVRKWSTTGSSPYDSTITTVSKVGIRGNVITSHMYLTEYAKSYPNEMIVAEDGGVVVTGNYIDERSKYDLYVIRANPEGVVNAVFQNESICMVTVDPFSGKNLVTWEKTPGEGTSSFNIYKETSVAGEFSLIGNVPFSDVSSFVDSASSPAVRADRYKISCVNALGLESMLSTFHKTMHLTINKGLGNTYNLIWDHYEGFPFGTYNIYRGTASDNMMLIASLPNTLTSFTDLQAPANKRVFYQVSVVKLNPCVPNSKVTGSLKSDSGPYSQSLSNIAESELYSSVGGDTKVKTYGISPNPAVGSIKVVGGDDENVDVAIFNDKGQMVFENFVKTGEPIYVTDFIPGVYLVQIAGNKTIVREKLVVKR